MSFVFISFSHKDSEYACEVVKALEKRGLECWIDDRIDYGTQWPSFIQEKLDECSAVVVIMTPTSEKSRWVQNELAYTQNKGKPIFPMLLDGEVFLLLAATQYVDVRGGKPLPEKLLAQIARTVSPKRVKRVRRSHESDLPQQASPSVNLPNSDAVAENKEPCRIEYGIALDDFGKSTISIAPDVFFARRISQSFPGIEGLRWFLDPKEAISRLEILLRSPISFEESNLHGVHCDPIWWFRGGYCLPVNLFTRLSETRCLVDVNELEIDKLAVFRSTADHRSLVYVEVRPDEPVGLYEVNTAHNQAMIESRGYAKEEYGLYQGTPITLACFDDGAAVINGVVVNTRGAKLRVRYLSRYNFLLASKASPINSKSFDRTSGPILDDMLRGRDRLDELCRIIEELPRTELR